MAKTYVNTVKYEIMLNFEIDGIVDKPDIIGAIFGQSEGLLGDEMDLKELQKNGKLGRIEIRHSTSMGRTKGEVVVPSSLDMAETSLLAAGIESVDKVGPCESHFEIIDIKDTRTEKRNEIKDRAKTLLEKMMDKNLPQTEMLSEEIKERVRASDITTYGSDKLPAGPQIESSQEIIVVEGRADVLNLLKNQIKNVIGMNGSNISNTISELGKTKSLVVFVDGDRGGILNARKLIQLAKVAFIAKAPDGKEVEELTRKEIIQSLKKRTEVEEEFGSRYRPRPRSFQNNRRERSSMHRPMVRTPHPRLGTLPSDYRGNSRPRHDFSRSEPRPINVQKPIEVGPPLSEEEKSTYKPMIEELKGSMKAKILNDKNSALKEVKVKDLVTEIGKVKKPHAVVFDGVITKRLFDAAEKAGIKYVVGVRKGKVIGNTNVKVATL